MPSEADFSRMFESSGFGQFARAMDSYYSSDLMKATRQAADAMYSPEVMKVSREVADAMNSYYSSDAMKLTRQAADAVAAAGQLASAISRQSLALPPTVDEAERRNAVLKRRNALLESRIQAMEWEAEALAAMLEAERNPPKKSPPRSVAGCSTESQ